MNTEEKMDILLGTNEDAVTLPDFADALIGICSKFGQDDVALYDYDKCVQVLVKGGMTSEEAVEWMDYNVIGAYLGMSTPAFAFLFRE